MQGISIECNCGAVGVELSGAPIAQFFCHCSDCQKAHGAAVVPVALYPAGAVQVVRGEPAVWALRHTPRTSCAGCGTRLFAEPTANVRGVIATLLPTGMFTPQFHIFCASAIAPIKDALPHYAGLPPKLGGSDAVVEW